MQIPWALRLYFYGFIFVIVNFANALYYQVKNFPLKISLVKIGFNLIYWGNLEVESSFPF